MKKCYNFLMVLATVILCLGANVSLAQDNVIFSEDFSAVTGSGTQQCEAANSTITNSLDDYLPGWTGDYVYPANGKVKLSTSSASGWIQTPEIDLSEYESVRVSFQARAWNGNDATTMTVLVGTNSYSVSGLPNTGSTQSVECDLANFSIIAAGGGAVSIRFEGTNRVFIDNIAVTPATEPVVEVQGTTSFTNVAINQEISSNLTARGYNLTAGGTTTIALSGDSQFATTVTTASNDDLMAADGVNIPFTFTATEAGSYTATLTLTNSDITEPVTVDLTATVVETNEVSTIAGLRALIDNSNVNQNYTDSIFYKYTGHAYVTQTFRSGSNTKWIQDETGAIQLYDPNGHLSNVAQGMEITNLIGKMCNYFGYVEMNVQSALATSDINAFPTTIPEPVTITLDQLEDQTYMDGIQGQLVRMENVTFGQTGVFERYGFYTVTQGSANDTAIYVTSNYDNIKDEEIPTAAVDIIGVNMRTAAYSAGYGSDRLPSRYYIIPREFAPVSGISENGKTIFTVYPNPTSDNITLTIGCEATHAAIYNVLGTQVARQGVTVGANTVNMSNLSSGVYFVRIFSGNETIGTVKVIRN